MAGRPLLVSALLACGCVRPLEATHSPPQPATPQESPDTPDELAIPRMTYGLYGLYSPATPTPTGYDEALVHHSRGARAYNARQYDVSANEFMNAATGVMGMVELGPADPPSELEQNLELMCRNAGLAYLMAGAADAARTQAARRELDWRCVAGLEHSLSLTSTARVTYLANAGILLTKGQHAVLIDGLHRFYNAAYAVLPDEQRHAIETAQAPYRDIDAIVVTHNHGDHVHAEAVLSHMQHNPRAHLYAAEQVVQAVRALQPTAEILARIHEVPAQPGAHHVAKKVVADEIQIEFLGLRHAGTRHTNVQNLGVIVHLGSLKIAHFGDAEGSTSNLEGFALHRLDIDVAFVPDWYLADTRGRNVVRQQIAAKRVFAIHIDPARRAATHTDPKVWEQLWPGVVPMVDMLRVWPLD